MYNRIGVIGIGSLGSYIAKSIYDSELCKELLIIDFDIVEKSNIRNSIYRKKDIGKYKVNALASILKTNDCTKVRRSRKQYESKITKIPKCDILIDCRDYTYDRLNDVHVRLYISLRFLCIDCRTNITYPDKLSGVYNSKLSKNDIKLVSASFTQLLEASFINKLIKDKEVYSINMDSAKEEISNIILSRNNSEELIVDSSNNCDKIVNLLPDCKKIIDVNQNMNAIFYIGDRINPIIKKEIPIQSFKNESDLIKFISSINFPFNYPSYYLSVTVNNHILYLDLLPETGAA